MASIITATTTSGLTQSADNSGVLQLASGTGNLVTVPSATGTMALTASPTFTGTATIPTASVTTLNSPSGVLATQNGMTGIPKAWCNFDGVGSITNLSAFNVSSITRNSTGDYTVNFTTAMPNTTYSIIGMAGNSNQAQATNVSVKYGTGQQNGNTTPTLKSTTQCTFVLGIGNSTTYYDSYGISIAVFSS